MAAEAILSSVIQRLSDLLITEAISLYGVVYDIDRVKAELKRMQCFLKDAELQQGEQDERVRNCVSEIRNVSYDIDDIIDTFVVKTSVNDGRFCRHVLQKLILSFRTRRQIESVRTRMADISNGMQILGMRFAGEAARVNSTAEMLTRVRRSYPHVDEEDFISMDECLKAIMEQLMRWDEKLRVVSIVGMGGLGKTTLAKKVYNHIEVKRHFDCYAWVFVSQLCSVKDVLLEILSKVGGEDERGSCGEMREAELVERVYEVLRGKRYLVVLDDIWRNEQWDCLRPAFPSGNNGSKVLFTTRNKEVAMYADPWSSPVEPPFLTEGECWELLCRKAFVRDDVVGNHNWPQDFEKLGREMMRKCGGLPLAVVVLGGLLATKSLFKEWEAVERNMNRNPNKFYGQQQQYWGVNAILALSYHELPFHLKPCFLYMGMFPEDWEISKTKLIRLWIAEGFIPQDQEDGYVTMEDIAEQYMEDLINRCMIQAVRKDSTGKGVKTCRVHDIMRDFCVSKAREENFLGIIQQQQDHVIPHDHTAPATNVRRISVHIQMQCQSHIPVVQRNPVLRSLVYFARRDQGKETKNEQQMSLHKPFRLLRVLDLERLHLFSGSTMLKGIGNLVHLRYLGFRSVSGQVPRSIVYLQCLQTLHISGGDQYIELPSSLSRLMNLRHLLTHGIRKGHCCRMDTFKNLKTLNGIHVKDMIRGDAILKLTTLRKLKISFDTSDEVEMFLQSPVVASGCLQTLIMRMLSEDSFMNLGPLSHCRDLVKLRMIRKIEDCHHIRHNLEYLPRNLCKLTLYDSELQQDPMPSLEKLTCLRILHLSSNSYIGSEMVCSVTGFRSLEALRLVGLWNLEEWHVAEGAMPSLQSLDILSLPKLEMVPEGLKFVTTLKKLSIGNMGRAFSNRVKIIDGVEGEDFDKVRHVPSILTY